MMSAFRGFSLSFVLLTTLVGQSALMAQSSSDHGSSRLLPLITSDPPAEAFFTGPVPRTVAVANDAGLNDICSVGDSCWAVGSRGVVLRSADAGATWTTELLPLECSLSSVCFLTNQTGFVAGQYYDHLERKRKGLILATKDGGRNWRLVEANPSEQQNLPDSVSPMVLPAGTVSVSDLPPLDFVRFFDLENAVAVGCDDVMNAASEVFRSSDGGRTWRVVRSDVPAARWRTGAFLSPDDGIVAGYGNAVAAVVSQQLVALSRPDNSFRRIHSTSLDSRGFGWLAGDAGLLQHSRDGGITWKPITNVLPPGLDDVIDFRTVCQRNSVVCVAGSPGSLVLRSVDGGESWVAAKTSQSVPFQKLHFVSDSTVIGLAALGIVHRSTDAGATWETVRNAGYRAAVLCLSTDPDDVSFRMLSSMAGDEGFRTVVVQPSVRLTRPGVDDALAADQLSAVLPQLGAGRFEQDWMFARTQPLQGTVADELMKAWARQTDGRVGELLPQRLAALFRIWRPDAVCIERSSDRDQVSAVWLQALETARQIAAGHDPRSAALDSTGLEHWMVSRVVVRQTDEHRTPLAFAADDLLSNLGTTVDLLADPGRRQLTSPAETDTLNRRSETFDSYAMHQADAATATFRHLLTGLMQAPGTESRRGLSAVDPDRSEQSKQLVSRLKIEQAALNHQAIQSSRPLNLIAHLQNVGSGLPTPLALQQLTSLVDMYEHGQNLDGQIAVLQEIVERFPATPAAADASQSLFQYYSSEELRFLRQKSTSTLSAQTPAAAMDDSGQKPKLQQVAGAGIGIKGGTVQQLGTGTPLDETLGLTSQGADTAAVAELWDRQAEAALQHLRQLSPERSRSPEMLLRMAANRQRVDDYPGHNQLVAQAASGDGLYAVLAQAEMQSVHGAATTAVPVVYLPLASSKPYLDAVLTDQIWQDATEIPLTESLSTSSASSSGCLVMLAWDVDHVYVSARVERVPGRDYPIDRTAARVHDTDHGIRDRVEISFDTDRDYTTAFHFVIDEAGQTSERCWKSAGWNPDWFVAADADDTSWRFEVAIPQSELARAPVRAGSLWAVNIRRTVPGILQQALHPSAADTADTTAASGQAARDTQGYGLLRFIRPQK
ncbi:MAG: YCF48-related protein [Planctomycetaceae bacterium]